MQYALLSRHHTEVAAVAATVPLEDLDSEALCVLFSNLKFDSQPLKADNVSGMILKGMGSKEELVDRVWL